MRADTLPGRVIAVVSRRAPAFQPLPGERTGLAWALRTVALRAAALRAAVRDLVGVAGPPRPPARPLVLLGRKPDSSRSPGPSTRPSPREDTGADTGADGGETGGADGGEAGGGASATGGGADDGEASGAADDAEQTVTMEPWRRRPQGAAGATVAARLRRQGVLVGVAALLALAVGGFALTVVVPTHWSPAGTTSASPTGPATATSGAPVTGAAVSTVLRYFGAINERDYRTAWEIGGRNLGDDYSTFVHGFADLASDTVTATEVRGDRVTVDLVARTNDGGVERYRATYTVVDGVITAGTAKRMS